VGRRGIQPEEVRSVRTERYDTPFPGPFRASLSELRHRCEHLFGRVPSLKLKERHPGHGRHVQGSMKQSHPRSSFIQPPSIFVVCFKLIKSTGKVEGSFVP